MNDVSDESVESTQQRRVIVAGYGPVGRVIIDNLEEAGIDVTIIELNPNTVENQSRLGRSIIHGDAANPSVLERAGIGKADALIVTIPDQDAAVRACSVARQLVPDIYIAVRTKHLSRSFLAAEAGADHVTSEEIAVAEQMQRAVMDRFAGG